MYYAPKEVHFPLNFMPFFDRQLIVGIRR